MVRAIAQSRIIATQPNQQYESKKKTQDQKREKRLYRTREFAMQTAEMTEKKMFASGFSMQTAVYFVASWFQDGNRH